MNVMNATSDEIFNERFTRRDYLDFLLHEVENVYDMLNGRNFKKAYKRQKRKSKVPMKHEFDARGMTFLLTDVDEERLYSTDTQHLMKPVYQYLTKERLYTFNSADFLTSYQLMVKPKIYKSVDCKFWVMRQSIFLIDETIDIVSTPHPINEHGRNAINDGENDLWDLYRQCSIIEDLHRIGAFKVTVVNNYKGMNCKIQFPISVNCYKEFLKLREAPRRTPTGKLNPIIHFCKAHYRTGTDGDIVKVKQYWKGTQTIVIDGLSMTLELNDGSF